MKNTTLFLPGLHLPTLRRRPRSEAEKLADQQAKIRQKSLSHLDRYFKEIIPSNLFSQQSNGSFSRRRVFSKQNTFWAFFSQILNADHGCQEVVRKIQAYALSKGMSMPSSSTSAYCQARKKLPQSILESVIEHTGQSLQSAVKKTRWKKRRVIVVDGTGLSTPDTQANQAIWPQPNSQKPGCGFPQLRLCACFCLQSGALLSYGIGSQKKHELPLLRDQLNTFKRGDVLLGDKGFCSYYDVSLLLDKGVDSVFTLARRKPVNSTEAIKVLGDNDLLIRWRKPAWNKVLSYTRAQWDDLPDELILRQIKVTINQPGFRTQEYYLITSLIDSVNYRADELASLYYQRWDVELFFRDIKTTLDMNVLKCKTPSMVEKEIAMHWIVYNTLRWLIVRAAQDIKQAPRRISFKASLQALRQWEPSLNLPDLTRRERQQLLQSLLAVISQGILLLRPGRREPRCVKRRPKPFALLTKPRHEMVEIPHRNRYRANTA